MDWSWFPVYLPQLISGIWITFVLLVLSMVFGFILAVPLGLAQAAGPWWLAWPSRAFCTFIRGTPLLVQIWFIYYGLGVLFPMIPGLRQSFLWPFLREGFYYAVVARGLGSKEITRCAHLIH